MQASVLWEVFLLNSFCGVMFPDSCAVSCYFEHFPHLSKKNPPKKHQNDYRPRFNNATRWETASNEGAKTQSGQMIIQATSGPV